MSMLRGCLLRLGLAAIGVLIALSGAELGIRWIESQTGTLFYSGLGNPEYDPRFVQPSPYLLIEHRSSVSVRILSREHPGGYFTVRTNNLGLRRDDDTEIAKPANVFRILVLGDSQTDGLVNNSESWPNVLEQLLNQQTPRADGRRYEVLDAGVIIYQPWQEYLWWKLYGQRLHPDMVILGYYLGNDLLAAGGDRLAQNPDGTWQFDDSPHPVQPESPLRAFLGSCRVCVLASYPIRGGPLEAWGARLGLVGSAVDDRYLQAHRLCAGCAWQSLTQTQFRSQDDVGYRRDLQASARILQMLNDEAAGMGAIFTAVLIPSKLQVEGDIDGRAAEVARILDTEISDPPFEDGLERDLAGLIRQSHIYVVEVTRELKQDYAQEHESLYYSSDWHLNPMGNVDLAQAVIQHLGATLRLQ